MANYTVTLRNDLVIEDDFIDTTHEFETEDEVKEFVKNIPEGEHLHSVLLDSTDVTNKFSKFVN